MLELTVHAEGKVVARKIFDAESVSIGRDPLSGLRLDAAGVGPLHAWLHRRGNGYVLEPLGPATVNGQEIAGTTGLSSGDRFGIGRFSIAVEHVQELAPPAPAAVLDPPTRKAARVETVRRERDTRLDQLAQELEGELPKSAPAASPPAPATRRIRDERMDRVVDALEESDTFPRPAPVPERDLPSRPLKLMDIVTTAERSGVAAIVLGSPVLLSRASLAFEEAREAIVYPLAGMKKRPTPYPGGEGERAEGLTVGRSRECDVTVEDSAVSKLHATLLRRTGDRWSVADEGSSNGTYVDGDRLTKGEPSDLGRALVTLRFGPKARFTFMREAAFAEYLSQLLEEKARAATAYKRDAAKAPSRSGGAVAPTAPTREVPLPSPGTLAPADLGARVLASIEAASATAARWIVTLESGKTAFFDSWPEVESFVLANSAKIVSIEICPPGDRPGTIGYLRK